MNRRQMLRIANGGFIAAAALPALTGCNSSMPPRGHCGLATSC